MNKIIRKFYVDGRVEECVDERMTLEQMQFFVGGSIEYVPTKNSKQALVVNEEGTFDNLPQNQAATMIVRPGVLMVDGYIRGNALLIWA